MNANVLYRWLKQGHTAQSQDCIDTAAACAQLPSFIPLPFPMNPPQSMEREIKVEVRSGGLVMTISWPISAASDFAQWSTAILK
jgi:transposase